MQICKYEQINIFFIKIIKTVYLSCFMDYISNENIYTCIAVLP